MGEILKFETRPAGGNRREFEAAARKVIRPLMEVCEVLRWHAWSELDGSDDPEAAVEAWQSVEKAIRAIQTLAEMSPQWWAIVPGQIRDDRLFELTVEDIGEKFAPAFVKAMRAGVSDHDA